MTVYWSTIKSFFFLPGWHSNLSKSSVDDHADDCSHCHVSYLHFLTSAAPSLLTPSAADLSHHIIPSCHHRSCFFTTSEKSNFTTLGDIWVCAVCVCMCPFGVLRLDCLAATAAVHICFGMILVNTREASSETNPQKWLLSILFSWLSFNYDWLLSCIKTNFNPNHPLFQHPILNALFSC